MEFVQNRVENKKTKFLGQDRLPFLGWRGRAVLNICATYVASTIYILIIGNMFSQQKSTIRVCTIDYRNL